MRRFFFIFDIKIKYMKGIITIALLGGFMVLAQPLIAQEALLDKLADAACACITKKDTDSMSNEDLQMQLGFCIMEAVGANQAAFEKEYGALDPSDQSAMSKLGEQIGMKMAFKCPNVIMRMAGPAASAGYGCRSCPSC